jgi:hypothetical protein
MKDMEIDKNQSLSNLALPTYLFVLITGPLLLIFLVFNQVVRNIERKNLEEQCKEKPTPSNKQKIEKMNIVMKGNVSLLFVLF